MSSHCIRVPPASVSISITTGNAVGSYLAANSAQVIGDIPNYTDIQPVIEVTEVLG